jgi:hypothetical protein
MENGNNWIEYYDKKLKYFTEFTLLGKKELPTIMKYALIGIIFCLAACAMDGGSSGSGSPGSKTKPPTDGSPTPGVPARDTYDTASMQLTRNKGLGTEGEGAWTGWPPKWPIAIRFPPSVYERGNFDYGEGTVTETAWSQLEKDIVWEINKFRADPVAWCNENGLPMLDGISAHEEFQGSGPRRHNYTFPAPTLQPSQGLHQAALHQCLRGTVAHSDQYRVRVYVNISGWGENVGSYSGGTGAAIVAGFIRDSGIADKGHRINIANPSWQSIGIGCLNKIIVMEFGSGVSDKNP